MNMCNYYSGHIVTEKGKNWGKILMITGVHHEIDREDPLVKKFGENLLAWETKKSFTFSEGIKFTHSCGKYIREEEKQALRELILSWAKKKGDKYFLKYITEDEWKYKYCRDVKDREELWSTIKEDEWKVYYCQIIKDRKELWSTIEEDEWKVYYCRDIKDREELWSTIKNDYWKYRYCRDIKDREELWSTIKEDYWKFYYCQYVKDREELWSTIKEDYWKYRYCRDIKDREELH